MKKLAILVLSVCSLSWISCSSGNQSPSGSASSTKSQPSKLETAKANETLNQWALGEERKASDLLKMGDNTSGGIDRVRVIAVEERGNVAEASFNFQTMAMFLEGKSVKMISGSGNAIFEWKDGKWFLMKVTSAPSDFVRDNLMIEVK